MVSSSNLPNMAHCISSSGCCPFCTRIGEYTTISTKGIMLEAKRNTAAGHK
ncbi:hypothetical protein RchiOBHm_Chr1g0354871 [Rosa chinensis]|uniref:Uncharacterized protein n=1 Tax=Rosa chinensis TaxID=74649 RepID=A0A2P6SH96_ROSCH|nr:hypothetical protein RchiOBHm_Chr1g0354871 [Rosa chinensis]